MTHTLTRMPRSSTHPRPHAVSKADQAERLEFCRRLVVRCVSDHEIARMAAEKFQVNKSTPYQWVAKVRKAYRDSAQRQLSPDEIGMHRGEQIEMVKEVISKAWQEIAAQEHKSGRLFQAERLLKGLSEKLATYDAEISETLEPDIKRLQRFLDGWEPNHRGRVAQMSVILTAIRLLADLTGTVVQKVEVTGAGGGPIKILEGMSDTELDAFLETQGVTLTLLQGGRNAG